jgi:hypothetical protein
MGRTSPEPFEARKATLASLLRLCPLAKRLLVKFDLERGRGSGEIAYLETRR